MYNKIVVLGNLTRDIELRYMPNGSVLAKSASAYYAYNSIVDDLKRLLREKE